jgi:hypothetical protein
MRVQRVGHWLAQVELSHLLVHISRHKLAGGRQRGNAPLGSVDARQAGRTAPCLARYAANDVPLLVERCRNVPTVSMPTALYINQVADLAILRRLWATCSRGARRRSNSWRAACVAWASCSRLAVACGGRPGPRW